MDSLFCKIGSLRALLPASPGRPCEGSCDASQAAQSVRICACRSPPSSEYQASTITSGTPPPAEEATSKRGSFLHPLPLLSSHSAIPAPLKFLWFNRKNTERNQDPWVPGLAEGDDQSMLLDGTGTSNERIGENAQIESNVNEVLRLMEKQDVFENSDVDVHGQKEKLFESKENVQAKKKTLHVSKADSPAKKETLDDLNGNEHDVDMAKQVNLDEFKVDDGLSRGTNSSDNLISTSSPIWPDGSWISRIAEIKAFWPDPKIFKKQSTSTHAPSKESDSASFSSLHSGSEAACAHTSQSSEAEENDCNFNCALGCSLEVPYTKVLHTKESFSKFLQDASLYDMKVFAQLAFLCDMAYMIPDIQPAQLMKYHRLRLVTSSLDKKSEAESKAKEDESSKKLSTSIDNGGVKSNMEPSQFNLDSLSEPNPVQPSKSAHTNQVQTDLSCHIEEWKAYSLPQIAHREGKSISSSVLELLEENKAVKEDSLMAIAPVTATMLTEEETKLAAAKDLQSSRSCPCEWFVCDEPSTYTRIFIIQGSESLASWQANLFFEPINFEELDVFVHRGIYEAANAMYDQVLPEVLAHIATHGDLARARFTGHSLGGSLATLLALMFQIRGILSSTAILPVVTFGSPCIMCGGDYLLQKLKLPKNHIQSLMMHRDVVPRAFACDYPDHVAEVLKRLNGRFRDHPCLNNQKLLYAPMGQIWILQPNENAAPPHPLLPDGHGLYVLRHPMNGDDVENAIELRGAQRAFLNMPHPLDILGDPGAYGFDGAVSRDHDPQSYTKAIHVVLKHEVKRLRRVQREQRRQLWWPLVLAESSSLQKGIRSDVNLDHSKTTGALTSSISRTSRFFKAPVNYAIAKHIGFSMRGGSIWESHKDAFSTYTRLIASQHVQMGMLLVLSLRLVILECLSTLYVWI